MPSDTSYLFFQRELENGDDDGGHQGPSIRTPRVIRDAGYRGGSVPPMHIGSGSVRAMSVQPSSSGRRRPIPGQINASGTTNSGLTMTDIGKDGQMIVRRIISPSSVSAAMAVGRSLSPTIHRSSRRASISGPSNLFGESGVRHHTLTSNAGGVTKRSSVYFPSNSSYSRSTLPVSTHRRASIAVTSPSTFYGSHRYQPSSANNHIKTTTTTTTSEATTDNNHPKKKIDFTNQLEMILPWQNESLSNLRARTQVARDQLSRHRVMLDRYLPVYLGPELDVKYEVESRYGELLSRMPHLEQREQRKQKEDLEILPRKIEPYKPASLDRMPTYGLSNVTVSNSFTPKVSDTRKRARSVLCKVKGDPNYFNYH